MFSNASSFPEPNFPTRLQLLQFNKFYRNLRVRNEVLSGCFLSSPGEAQAQGFKKNGEGIIPVYLYKRTKILEPQLYVRTFGVFRYVWLKAVQSH